jgi:uncharacterized protein
VTLARSPLTCSEFRHRGPAFSWKSTDSATMGVMPSPGRRDEVEAVLRRVAAWAEGEPDIVGVALVGSWAAGNATDQSDVDLVVLTWDVDKYVDDEEWIKAIGEGTLVRTQEWGMPTERRVRLGSGLEVEFGFVSPERASTDPIDPGTRTVVENGLLPLRDPHRLLAVLDTSVRQSAR